MFWMAMSTPVSIEPVVVIEPAAAAEMDVPLSRSVPLTVIVPMVPLLARTVPPKWPLGAAVTVNLVISPKELETTKFAFHFEAVRWSA